MNSTLIDGRVINVSVQDPFRHKQNAPDQNLRPSFIPRQAAKQTSNDRKAPKIVIPQVDQSKITGTQDSKDSSDKSKPTLTQADFRAMLFNKK